MNKINTSLLLTSTILGSMALVTSAANANVLDTTEIKIGGYVKADFIASSYSDGALGSGNIGRDFYIPSLTPVGGSDEDSTFDAHAKQTRFNFSSKTQLENGETVGFTLEFDFLATPNGNERITNSYTPRMRHAVMNYNGFSIGQTWSNFQDVGILPESLDFIGVTAGTVFSRQTQVRYTTGGFSVSIENPESTITPNGGGSRIVADDNSLPDFTAKYTHKADWGHVAIAGLARQLSYSNKATNADPATEIDSDTSSFGVTLSSKIKFGQDDLRLSVTKGSGLGRYLGLNFVNGAVIDSNGELEAIDSTALTAAYRHVWNEQFRSNVFYSAIQVDNNTNLTGEAANNKAANLGVNLLYSPAKALTFGAELSVATRELENGSDGDMNRLQFSAKYAF